MVDKRAADHREAFHNPIGTEIIEAVTVAGGPCEGSRIRSASEDEPSAKAFTSFVTSTAVSRTSSQSLA
jgi:hypothetical protein